MGVIYYSLWVKKYSVLRENELPGFKIMCLILLSYKQHQEYTLILAANRDEFYARPTLPASRWPEGLVAGKDLKAGGTWMGVHPDGRFGMVTNYRDPASEKPQALSRGNVVVNYLAGEHEPEGYLEGLHSKAEAYNGYNTLLGSPESLWYYSNKEQRIKEVQPGLYGLSNHLLDTAWPKVVRGKKLLASVLREPLLNSEALFEILKDDTVAPDDQLPETGVPLEWERTLSAMFIQSPQYGTRCSTILTIGRSGELAFHERTYPTDGDLPSTISFEL